MTAQVMEEKGGGLWCDYVPWKGVSGGIWGRPGGCMSGGARAP